MTASSRSKTYGQTVTFTGTEFTTSGLLTGDTVTSVSLNSSGTAATAPVAGSPYAIAPSNAAGTGLANYNINYVNGSLTVNRATLTVSGITADNKPFDGTTAATIHTDGATLAGQVSGDDVTLNTAGATGAFADASAGTGKTVYITGLTLNGATAVNYSLIQPTTTADITGGGLTVVGIEASNKVYDGTTNATLNVTNAALVGVASGDDVSLDTTNAVGAFADNAVGTGKTVYITGLALFGTNANKYTLTQPTTTADITPASSATSLASAQNPSAQGSNVTFTATVSPVAPATTTPTGNVQFLTNGIACGSPVALSSGVATLSTAGLPAGTNTVTAAYLGDGNFNGSTNSLAQVVAAANIGTPGTLGIQDNGQGTVTVTLRLPGPGRCRAGGQRPGCALVAERLDQHGGSQRPVDLHGLHGQPASQVLSLSQTVSGARVGAPDRESGRQFNRLPACRCGCSGAPLAICGPRPRCWWISQNMAQKQCIYALETKPNVAEIGPERAMCCPKTAQRIDL